MVYNSYTQTNDYPEVKDFLPKDSNGNLIYSNFALPPNLKIKAQSDFQNAVNQWAIKYKIPQAVLDEWAAQAIAALPMPEQLNFWEKMRLKYKAAATTVRNTATSITTAARNVARNIATNLPLNDSTKTKALLLLFAPLAPIAKVFLSRKGITPSNNLSELVQQVYNEKSRANFGLSSKPADSFDYLGLKGTGHFEKFGFGPEDISPEMVTVVLQFLNQILSSIKAKKANNQPLSDDEQKIADLIPQTEGQPQNATEGFKILGFDWKVVLGTLLLIALIWYFFLRK